MPSATLFWPLQLALVWHGCYSNGGSCHEHYPLHTDVCPLFFGRCNWHWSGMGVTAMVVHAMNITRYIQTFARYFLAAAIGTGLAWVLQQWWFMP